MVASKTPDWERHLPGPIKRRFARNLFAASDRLVRGVDTVTMFDCTGAEIDSIPANPQAVMGYTNDAGGQFSSIHSYAQLKERYPDIPVVGISTQPSSDPTQSHGFDCEEGDYDAAQAADAMRRARLAGVPWRPFGYGYGPRGPAGYRIGDIQDNLRALGEDITLYDYLSTDMDGVASIPTYYANVIGKQYENFGSYDASCVLSSWAAQFGPRPEPSTPAPPTGKGNTVMISKSVVHAGATHLVQVVFRQFDFASTLSGEVAVGYAVHRWFDAVGTEGAEELTQAVFGPQGAQLFVFAEPILAVSKTPPVSGLDPNEDVVNGTHEGWLVCDLAVQPSQGQALRRHWQKPGGYAQPKTWQARDFPAPPFAG